MDQEYLNRSSESSDQKFWTALYSRSITVTEANM